MPLFTTKYPEIQFPKDQTIWHWLFEHQRSTAHNAPNEHVAAYINAITNARIDFQALRSHATHLSTLLQSRYQIQAGDSVIIFSGNTIWYPVAMFAILRLGGIVTGASPSYTFNEMDHMIKVSRAKMIFTSSVCLDTARECAKARGIPLSHIILLEGNAVGATSMSTLLEAGQTLGEEGQVEAWRLPRATRNGEVCAFLPFSSGTTGMPKAVMISHQNMIAQCYQLEQVTAKDLSRVLAALPFYHITGLVHSLVFPLFRNIDVVMLPSFTLPDMLEAVVRYRIEELLVVPPIVLRLVQDPIVDKYDLTHVKRFFCGAAPLSKIVLSKLRSRFPGTGFKQGYGMTEACSAVTLCPPELYSFENADKVGCVLGNTEIKVIDTQGRELGVGEPGEICIRGPQIAMGYFQNAQATAATFDKDGFLHSGDEGVFDSRGLLKITDRLKEMIKVKGIGVAPAELEDLLLNHPIVADCAVISTPDERAGERPKAFIVLNSDNFCGNPALGRKLIEYVRKNKVRDKWLKEVQFVDSIIKSAAGKILRKDMKIKYANGGGGLIVRSDPTVRAVL